MTPEEKLARADQARQLMLNPLLNELLETMREEAVDALADDDNYRREDLIADIRAVKNLRQALQSIVTTGKLTAERGK